MLRARPAAGSNKWQITDASVGIEVSICATENYKLAICSKPLVSNRPSGMDQSRAYYGNCNWR
jgi:hypothetical protein